jgi:hypothetical protein
MAKKTITILTDDLDGEELPAGSRSTRFALDGVEYEIDLSAANARALADALAPYVSAGRRVGGGARGVHRPAPCSRQGIGCRTPRRHPLLGAGQRVHRRRPWPHQGRDRRRLRGGALS